MIAKGQTFIGIIADTHGQFDQAIIEHFAGVTTILHAGDIGDLRVICQLKRIAPVVAVSGNVDQFEQSGFPRMRVVRRAGVTIAMRHILFERGKLTVEARAWLDEERPDVCVFGHSHRPTIAHYGPTLLFNPGSAGPQRFLLPRGVGMLTIVGGRIEPRVIPLQPKPDGSETIVTRTEAGMVMLTLTVVHWTLWNSCTAISLWLHGADTWLRFCRGFGLYL